MTYVRHRKRQVAQSVFADMTLRLTNRGWLGGSETPPLLAGVPLTPIPAFPDDVQGEGTAINTLAVNSGEGAEIADAELGGGLYTQEYTFHFAFYAVSDAAADALFQDLHDEWAEDWVPLYDYSVKPATLAVKMEVVSFAWTQASSAQMNLAQRRLHFGRLIFLDYVDDLNGTS